MIKYCYFLSFFLFLLFFTPKIAAESDYFLDEFENDDPIELISISSPKQSDSFQEKATQAWTENGKGYFTSSYSFGDTKSSFSNLLLLTYSHSFGDTLFISSFEGFNYTQKFQRKVSLWEYSFESGWTENIFNTHVSQTKKSATFRELYFKHSVGSNLEFRIGKQLVIWGQMPLMSMVDFILPREFSKTPSSISKLDNRVPMDTLSLSYYPFASLEMTAYLFNKIILPNWQDESVDFFLKYQNNPVIYEDQKRPFAVRSVWRHPFFTLGITYFKGMHWQPVHGYPLESFPFYGYSTITDSFQELGTIIFPDYSKEYMLFGQTESYGFEISKPVGPTTFVFEVSKSTQPWAIEDSDSWYRSEVFDWLYANNHQSNIVTSEFYMYSLGIYGNYRWGDLIFLIFSQSRYFPDYAIESSIIAHENDYLDDAPIFGLIFSKNIFEASRLGFGVGYIPEGVGLSLFLNSEYKENWKWTLSPQFIIPIDEMLSEDDPYWEPSLSFSVGRNF